MNKIKIILRCVIFFVIGIVIFHALTYILVPKWMSNIDPATPRIKGIYLEKPNSIDVLVVGASDVGRGYSPITVWEKYGITSYNLGTSNQTMSLAYYLIKENLKYQNPKVIVLDMDATFVNNDAPEGEYRKLFDNLKLSDVKIESINDKNLRVENKLSYYLPLLRFHSRWNKLESKDLKKSLRKEYRELSYKGMAMSNDVKPYNDNNGYMQDKGNVETISEENLYYIDLIVKLCEEKGIKLLWIEIPSATSWSLARNKATSELADKYGIEFIDFNLMMKELKFDWKKHTADKGNHLNVDGAEIISDYIGKVLQEKYNCENCKEDNNIKNDWEKETKRYKRNKKKLKNTQKK